MTSSENLSPNEELNNVGDNGIFVNNNIYIPNYFYSQRGAENIYCYYQGYGFSSFIMNENNLEDLMEIKPDYIDIINQREALTSQLYAFQLECTICLVVFQPEDPIWSCENCYNIFHLCCIKKWYESSVNDNSLIKWHCPTCKNEYSIPQIDIVYHCFCGKVKNPTHRRGGLMHSCEDVCSKQSKTNDRCPHLCAIKCHPGPCPPCEASITRKCHCFKTTMTVKCNGSELFLVCGSKCEKLLNCSVHSCQQNCHNGNCISCSETMDQQCNCGNKIRTVICGSIESSENFKCEKICAKMKDCKVHKCENQCHGGACESCTFLPDNVRFCQCGQTSLVELAETNIGNYVERKMCLDPIPVCDKICNKPYLSCEHKCLHQCHEGPCPPCLLSSNVRCRCGKTNQTIKCLEFLQLQIAGKSAKCTNRCQSKKICGNHRCNEICCDKDVHICEIICGKQLSCKQHLCERPCHQGRCPTCSNVTFDELYCECGITRALPPIACGQPLPVCKEICSRTHTCAHEVLHQCHNDERCPPCVVLTSKWCFGGHRILDNVLCFQSSISCGLPCHKNLPNCDHQCLKICHSELCSKEGFQCTQLCVKTRSDCRHPCKSPCHVGDCKSVIKPCKELVELKCSCGLKSANITCNNYQKILESDTRNFMTKKIDGLDLCFSEDKSISLKCGSDCKKATRSKLNQQGSEILQHENTFSGFLRDFSIKDPTFLLKVDKEFVTLVNKLNTERLQKVYYRFDPMNKEKMNFVQQLSKYFGLKIDIEWQKTVRVEAIKGVSRIPTSRLLQFMQKNYPVLFKTEKALPVKHIPQYSTNFWKNS